MWGGTYDRKKKKKVLDSACKQFIIVLIQDKKKLRVNRNTRKVELFFQPIYMGRLANKHVF